MTDPMRLLIEAGAVPATTDPPTSRYAATPARALDGTDVRYRARRLVPQPDRLATLGEHVVVEGDRLDLLAARYLGDPELWWRIADANVCDDPDELTQVVGRRLRIALPEGMPGVPDA